ncbi:PREDICTED: uncharacterized protein LOC109219642 [Nicotiana attenuata]|uniref:uncharacterized protein LOC109219642 n=1 Tax=Nicotiana attenuata TaxID=49451 RepID=UPI0009054761|nr:PREDICTED: uncharacterized protein LOC109219642 [Nicotiana attenuata]
MGPAGRDSRSKQENPRYGSRSRDRDAGSSSKFGKERDTRDSDRRSKAKIGGYSFNVSTSELVAVLRTLRDKVQWPKEMRSNLNRRNPNFWCDFHNDHGHKTTECRLLQGEVEHLLNQGYLTDLFSEKGKQAYMKNRQEPPKPPSPKRTVNVISGGEEVNDGVLIPHNDALMQADDKLVPKARTLSGFDNSSIVTKGEIILTAFAEGVVKDMKYQVIDMNMAYNMILGRPWIHEIDVVPSTLHQVIKFPLQWGIRQIRGDQQVSKSINSVADSSIQNDVADEK